MESPYEIAKAGGKHSGFYSVYVSRSSAEVRKAIRSLEKRILEHQSWIQNPELHVSNFYSLDSRQQSALVESKWVSDIARLQEQKQILEGVFQERR